MVFETKKIKKFNCGKEIITAYKKWRYEMGRKLKNIYQLLHMCMGNKPGDIDLPFFP